MLRLIRGRSVFMCLLSASVLSSCGALGFKKNADDDVQSPQLVDAKDVMVLSPEDPSCMSSGQSTATKSIQIWQWNGSSAEPKTVPFVTKAGSDQELVSKGTYGALWDLQFTRTCDYANGEAECKDAKIVKKPDIVKICRPDGAYGRESIESMTLTAQYMADGARDFYYKLSSSTAGLYKAILYIQPLELWHVTRTSDGKKIDLVQADNAAFASPSKKNDDYGVFWVYPTSKKSFGKSPVHLWEAAFVMHHEFGHNVFHHHVETAADLVGLTTRDQDHTLESIMRNAPKPHMKSMMLSDDSQAQKDLSGLNEMFADLFAYYNGDAAPDQLKGLGTLGETRDPSSAKTLAGTKKVWTAKESGIYTGELSAPKVSDGEPDFTDVHDVAAAFGYNIAVLIEAAMPGKSSVDKANTLIQWLNRLSAHITSSGKSATLDSMTAELVKAVIANKTGDVAKGCADFAANMSGLPLSIAACK